MKRVKNLFILLLLSTIGALGVWAANMCTATETPITISLTTTNPSSTISANTGAGSNNRQAYYYITVPSAGTVTFSNSSGSVSFYYSKTGCPTTASTALSNGSTIEMDAGDTDFNILVNSGSANRDFGFKLTFVSSGNTAPVANNDTAETNATAPVTIYVLANDTDADGTLVPSSVSIVSPPTKGTTAINTTNGAITYTPNSATYDGNDSFTYKVQDNNGTWSNNATVTITYPKPIAKDDSFVCRIRTTTNNAYIFNNVITNPPSDEKYEDNLTIYSVTTEGGTVYTAPWPRTITTTHGTLVMQSDGNFTYTPAVGFTGEDSVTYTIKNGYTLISNSATVMFYVNDNCALAQHIFKTGGINGTDGTCTTDINSSITGNVRSNSLKYYQIQINEPNGGILDINLSNTSNSMHLYYDFGNNCVELFNKDPDTTSVLDAEVNTVRASIPLTQGTYYLALKGDSRNNDTPFSISAAFRSSCLNQPPITPTRYRTVGINNPGLNYDVNKSITTKIVNNPFGLQVSYLNAAGQVAVYSGLYNNTTFPLSVMLQTADDNCQNENFLAKIDIQPGQSTVVATPLNINYAAKAKRIKTSAFDLAKYLGDATGVNCANSSMNSGLCLLPACLNADHKILEVFPPALFPHVMTCVYGNGMGQPPCQSVSYYGNCQGSKGNITPEKYNNVYGCAMCLADAMGGDICSEDNFAIRPKNFAFSLFPAAQSPNLLKSGEEHNITIHAYDAASPSADSVGYDQNSTNLSIGAIKRMPNDAINNDLNGTASFPNAFAFTNGLSSGANMTFNDVGKITVDLNDTNWAIVDADDTPPADLMVHGEGNFTYIPYQFKVSGPVRIVDSRDGNFTYFSNDLNMSAKFDLNVTSQNKQGGTTYNFDAASWEHPISAVPTVIDTLRGDANESNITNSTVGFASGVKHLVWDDANTSKVLKFNFPRSPSVPWDPVEVNATEANLSISATYTDTYLGVAYTAVPENNATNKAGATNGTVGNAIFLYGRADAPDYRFPQRDPNNDITLGCGRIYFEFYNTIPANPLVLSVFGGTMPPLSLSSDRNWYENTQHNSALGDGNVTSILAPAIHIYDFGANTTPPTCVGTLSGPGFEKRVFEYDARLTSGGFGYPYKSTSILNATDWLNVLGNNFGVEFYKEGKWVGEQSDTKTATDHDAETVTNRRILW